jgi:P4 family phage/plasmid primase-like protien
MTDKYLSCVDYLVNEMVIDEASLEACRSDRALNQRLLSDITIWFEDAMRASHFKFSQGCMYIFDGKVYRRTNIGIIEGLIMEVAARLKFPSIYRVNRVAALIARHCSERLAMTGFRPNKNLISFQNIVYDIQSGICMPHSPQRDVVTYFDFEFDPKAQAPRWKKFLNEVLPLPERQQMVQEFLGAGFLDRTRYKIEKMMFLEGTGQNGKGVLTSTIRHIFGIREGLTEEEIRDSPVSVFSPHALFKGDNNSVYNLSAINGKLFNISEDISNDDFSGGDFKRASSGEPMACRDPYGKPFTATDIPLFIASVNEFTKSLKDKTFGNYRRYWLVRFDVTIPKERIDTELSYKLMNERAGILNWILEGYRQVLDRGGKLFDSQENDAAVTDLKTEQDSCLRWLRDDGLYPKEPGVRVQKTMSEMFQMYCQYCKDWNSLPYGRNSMGKILSQQGFESFRTAGGMLYYYYKRDEGLPFVPGVEESKTVSFKEDEFPF